MTEKDQPEIGYDHPTTDTTRAGDKKALVLTHPFDRFTADEDEIVEFLEGEHEYDDVYYISQTQGRVPVPVDNAGTPDYHNMQSRLPPGFEDSHYERGLEEIEWGSIHADESEYLLSEYDEIAVAGAVKEDCVTNTLNSLARVRNTDVDYSATEVYMEDEITYSAMEDE